MRIAGKQGGKGQLACHFLSDKLLDLRGQYSLFWRYCTNGQCWRAGHVESRPSR